MDDDYNLMCLFFSPASFCCEMYTYKRRARTIRGHFGCAKEYRQGGSQITFEKIWQPTPKIWHFMEFGFTSGGGGR
uniref:Uncharacterized protein n=1 Tax=Globodera rostochiensis TaxID=31243 RepID=A0A914HUR0_GLORO